MYGILSFLNVMPKIQKLIATNQISFFHDQTAVRNTHLLVLFSGLITALCTPYGFFPVITFVSSSTSDHSSPGHGAIAVKMYMA